MKILGHHPDTPALVRRTCRDARRRVQERIARLKARGMHPTGPVAERVTDGPDLVGDLRVIYDITSRRIVFAAPGAIKS